MGSLIGDVPADITGTHLPPEEDAQLVKKYGKIRSVLNMPEVARNGPRIWIGTTTLTKLWTKLNKKFLNQYRCILNTLSVMKESDLDTIIETLSKALITNRESFEVLARQGSSNLSGGDLTYLRSKLHHPPPLPSDINEEELRLGEWLAICQYAIFELIYQLDITALDLLKSIAFGEYDWTQAMALEVICRLHLDGKLPENSIKEIDFHLGSMRHETHLYFAQSLLKRRERDPRFHRIIQQLKNIAFRLALTELGYSEPMTREVLIELGKRIVAANVSEEDLQSLMELFDKNVPRPNGSNLFYWPENFNFRSDDISEYNPTVEEVVDKCLSYKPIIL